MCSAPVVMRLGIWGTRLIMTVATLLLNLAVLALSVDAVIFNEGLVNHNSESYNQGFSTKYKTPQASFNSGGDKPRIATCLLHYRACHKCGGNDFSILRTTLSNRSSAESTQNLSSATVVIAFGGGLLATCALLCPCLRRQRKIENKDSPSKGTISGGDSSFGCSSSTTYSSSSQQPLCKPQGGRMFTLEELSKATKKFSPSCKIGQGGFGIVYKGKLEDGTFVAIKRAKKKDYDARLSTEFDNEVDMLLSIDHLNLVKMIGYLDESDERILVVEYVPNGNLREHLDGIHGVVLDLSMRLEICIDVAHALTYLHMYAGKPIIHRDVKPFNILLTDKFRAKVADFGYSRMGPIEIGETHVSTEIKGTTGYLDPEYLKTFQLTEKSDVYSFGIVLVEVVTGRRPIDEKKDMKERVALRWAFKKFLDGKMMEILDPRLEKTSAACKVAEKVCGLAFQCTAPTKQDRPTMKEVAEALWNIRRDFLDVQGGNEQIAELENAAGKITPKSFKLKEVERTKSSTR